jgi:ATP-binding cassette, subfamily B, bacterial PglK
MLEAIKASLHFMTRKERVAWYSLTALRAALSLSDLMVILAIGFVATSTALFLTEGSDPDRVLEFGGFELPAVNAQTLPWVAVSVLLLFLLKALLSLLLTRKSAFFVATVEARAAKRVAEISFGGDLSQARGKSREEMMFAVQSGSPAAFNVLLNSLNTFVTEATLFVLITLGFLLVDPWITLAALAYFGLVALTIQYFVGSRMTSAARVLASGSVKANTALGDLTTVFRELSVLRLRHKYIQRIYESRIEASNSAATTYYLNGMPRYIIEAALLVGIGIFVLLQSLSGDIVESAGTLGVFLAGGFRLTAALLPLQSSLLTLNSTVPSAMTALEILATAAKRDAIYLENENAYSGAYSIPTGPIGVVLEVVSFKYPSARTYSVSNVNMTIAPGEQSAFIGPSGAGKSTLADLICGSLTPTAGTILKTTEQGPLGDDVRASISYVPQSPGIVSGTIRENVALGVDDILVEDSAVWEALEQAHLRDVIAALPDGLSTSVGNLKDALSGGQLQRLGLARALYSKPSLLVMDEATSALDAESESEIKKALEELRGDVTVVIIAHRLNTIQHADTVFLIEEGRVVDEGKFPELVARNKSVDRLVKLMNVDSSAN